MSFSRKDMDPHSCESAAIHVKRIADCLKTPAWKAFEQLVEAGVFTPQEQSEMAQYFDYDQ